MNRELGFAPDHFVVSKTPITDESKIWIQEKLSGRYALAPVENAFLEYAPSFEDPKEAVFYELTWG
jgi:hypothetical protein